MAESCVQPISMASLVGRRLLRSGRDQMKEHVKWLESHGFDQDWDRWIRRDSPVAEPARLLQLSRTVS